MEKEKINRGLKMAKKNSFTLHYGNRAVTFKHCLGNNFTS